MLKREVLRSFPQRMLTVALAAVALSLAGCANLPRSMTSTSEFQQASKTGTIQLIPLTAQTLPLPEAVQTGFPASLIEAEEFAYHRLGPGDRVQVRIWETGTPTVFTAGSDLGELTVDESGKLYFPYIGAIQAAGQTVAQVRNNAISRLSRVVARPQVDIRATASRSTLVTVQGNAGKTGVYPIERGRTRLSSLLAEVAPTQENPEMLNVTVRRGQDAGQARLNDIYKIADLDIALRPGDSIILNEVVENVTVLGAAGVQGRVRIPERNFSLIDAIGQARGLSDDAADPRGVFLMRLPVGSSIPVVYQLDMRRPDAIALASRFMVRNDDAVLISSAPFAQTRKLLSAFAQTLSTVRSTTAVVP